MQIAYTFFPILDSYGQCKEYNLLVLHLLLVFGGAWVAQPVSI